MAFLKDKEVNKGLYYVCVYTPEGNFGRDINGIYEMQMDVITYEF